MVRSGQWNALTSSSTSGALWALHAQIQEQNGENSLASLRLATELSPREALFRSRLGLAEEADGDFLAAERDLVQATQLSRKYEPAWNLLNFYFRRSHWDRFWQVAAQALAVSYGDRVPLFDLCERAEAGSESGRARLQRILPASHDLRKLYAGYLLAQGEPASAAPFLIALADPAQPLDAAWLRDASLTLLQQHRIHDALLVWQDLEKQRLISEDPFPWRAEETGGATVRQEDGGAWRIALSGDQPEQCLLLSAIKPVSPGDYRLSWNSDRQITRGEPGLSWNVLAEGSGQSLGSVSAQESQLAFAIPGGMQAVHLQLQYQRPRGSVRAEGIIRFHDISLTRKGQP